MPCCVLAEVVRAESRGPVADVECGPGGLIVARLDEPHPSGGAGRSFAYFLARSRGEGECR